MFAFFSPSRIPITLCFCWVFWGIGCSSSDVKKEQDPIFQVFEKQLDQSCTSGKNYVKEVVNLTGGNTGIEQQTYPLGSVPKDEKASCILTQELSICLDRYHQSPEISTYFQTDQRGDTLIARVLPGQKGTTKLRHQKILWSSDKAHIRYIQSTYEESYWLYQTEKMISVTFDSLGSYQAHQLETYTKIFSIATPFHAQIKGHLE